MVNLKTVALAGGALWLLSQSDGQTNQKENLPQFDKRQNEQGEEILVMESAEMGSVTLQNANWTVQTESGAIEVQGQGVNLSMVRRDSGAIQSLTVNVGNMSIEVTQNGEVLDVSITR